MHVPRGRDHSRRERLDNALEREGLRRLDDLDAAAVADVRGAGLRGTRTGYTEPIGSGRDPLKVFTVVNDVDGRPAIRISGEVFGELRTTADVQGLSPEAAVQVGREEVAAARSARRRRATAACCITCTRRPAPRAAPGRVRSSCRFRNTTSAICTRSGSAIAVRAKPRAGTQPALYDYDPTGEWTFFSQIQGSSGRCIKQPDNEKPTGEWNTVELVCLRRRRIHIVNGKVVMRLHGPTRIDGALPTPVTSGPIILQSEGAEVFYRDIEIRPISAIPPEFAAK